MDNHQTVEEIQAELVQRRMKLEALRSRRDTIKEIMEDYQDLPKGIRDILVANQRNKLSGICGIIAELINVPVQYEISIESVLGSAVHYIVAETEESTRLAIAYLKTLQLGRVAFLSLDRISGKPILEDDKQKASSIKGYIGPALELISFDPQFQNIFYHLLGNVIIADDLPAAEKISKKLKQQYCVVTLEGDLINIGGIVIGGSLPSRSLILSRQRQIAEIEQEIVFSEQKIMELKALLRS